MAGVTRSDSEATMTNDRVDTAELRAGADTAEPWLLLARLYVACAEIDRLRGVAEPKGDVTPIDSPSEICALIGCKRRDDHQHDVVEHPNRGGDL